MKFIPPPLQINCDGLSKKLVHELADRLALHFTSVTVWGDDEIVAEQPHDMQHYDAAWHLIDKFGVNAA